MGASDWPRSIWQDRAAFAAKPALILWGLEDIAFRRKELERLKSALRDVEVREFKDCGHSVVEEAPGGWWSLFGDS
ncbi:MAG: alpha/beta fold hydrolase [Holophagales bacterium]|nr:alpha/beta fold hydrolase [Holophagales bacterium]MYC11428.1 alpha/beta fold hydrolase [Holophagales bacterium]